jgi:hypothetical protein
VSDPKADYKKKGYTLRLGEWPLAGAQKKADAITPGKIQRAPEFMLPKESHRNLWWEERPPADVNKGEDI